MQSVSTRLPVNCWGFNPSIQCKYRGTQSLTPPKILNIRIALNMSFVGISRPVILYRERLLYYAKIMILSWERKDGKRKAWEKIIEKSIFHRRVINLECVKEQWIPRIMDVG